MLNTLFKEVYGDCIQCIQCMHLIHCYHRSTFQMQQKWRKYILGYTNMATEFRKYWIACRCDDRVVMESIQNKWIGVHLVSGKHKRVENYLTAMETEYKKISNTTLQEIRMNICCRYHCGNDSRGNNFPLHTLYEVQENVNAWTKRLLMGPDEISWKLHSPNVACAHMCVNFEESEYVRSQLDYSDKKHAKIKSIHRTSKTVEPRKLLGGGRDCMNGVF